VEPQVPRHPGRGLDTVVGGGSDYDHVVDPPVTQLLFEVGADERRVDILDHHRFPWNLTGVVDDLMPGALGPKPRVGVERSMSDVEHGSALGPEVAE